MGGKTLRTQVALYLDDEDVKRLAGLSEKTGKTKQELLRMSINLLLTEYEWVRSRSSDGKRPVSEVRKKRKR
jgi:predicted DNA-binding protein